MGREFENGVLREIFEFKRDEVTGEWRKPHKGELHVASSPNIILLIKSRRVRWAGHVACMGDRRGLYKVLVRRPEGKRLLERPRRRWEDDIKWICMKWDEESWTGLIWLRIGTVGGRL